MGLDYFDEELKFLKSMLQETFKKLLFNYTYDEDLVHKFWFEITSNYSGKMRYYHNLEHLENLLHELIAAYIGSIFENFS